jgi:hypothetical protein
MATQAPARLASEDVIINAPLSYAGSAQRIWRIRRHATEGWKAVAITLLAAYLILLAWTFVTSWYLFWGLLLVSYRLLRRGARKRTAEALRHRELMGTIQGAAAASSSAIMTSQVSASILAPHVSSPNELIADTDRDGAIEELREHMLDGRLTTQEFEQRVADAHAARTRMELDAVTMNLPVREQQPAAASA